MHGKSAVGSVELVHSHASLTLIPATTPAALEVPTAVETEAPLLQRPRIPRIYHADHQLSEEIPALQAVKRAEKNKHTTQIRRFSSSPLRSVSAVPLRNEDKMNRYCRFLIVRL